jgi:hypothetical protein
MESQEVTEKNAHDFAEKCRKALEQSYGCQIPTPKHIVKTR